MYLRIIKREKKTKLNAKWQNKIRFIPNLELNAIQTNLASTKT